MPRGLYPAIIHADAVTEVVADLARTGAAVPRVTPVADIPARDRDGAALVTLLPTRLPGRSKVISITPDEDLIAQIDAVAARVRPGKEPRGPAAPGDSARP